MATNFYGNMGHYEKLSYLSSVVKHHCKKTHFTLAHYVLNASRENKSKQYVKDFDKLSLVNEEFEFNYDSFVKKYGYQLEGRTGGIAVVTPAELLAFTKAYELQKEELKKEIVILTGLGASKKIIEKVENDLVIWATFHKEFYEHIQIFKE